MNEQSQTATEKKRDVSSDIVKGLAIFLMVYGHIIHVGSLSYVQDGLVRVIYTLHMPIFLILSGFYFTGFKEPKEGVRRILSRLIRPYVIFGGLYLIALMLSEHFLHIRTANSAPTSFQEFFETLVLHPKGGYWFLHTLVILQLSICIGALIGSAKGEAYSLCFGLAFIMIADMLTLVSDRSVVFFCIGVAIGRPRSTVPKSLLLGLALLGTTLYENDGVPFAAIGLTTVAWDMGALLVVMSLSAHVQKFAISEYIAWLGRNSLAVLVFHTALLQAVKPFIPQLLAIDATGFTYSVISVLAGSLGSVLMFWLLDRLNLSKHLLGIHRSYSPVKF